MKTILAKTLSASALLIAATTLLSSPVFAGDVVHTGNFQGKSDHITTGQVTIEKVANGYLVVLADDFSLDGAPDPSVGFGKNGEFDTATQIGDLVSKTGEQTYLVSDAIEISDYNEVYIWCDKFSVPLGVATYK